MVYREEQGDLFELEGTHKFAHCVSADFALGAGIAKEFAVRYRMRRYLKEYVIRKGIPLHFYHSILRIFPSIRVTNTFNLVTKERCWHKPTYETLQRSLDMMRIQILLDLKIEKIAMPRIGCGLDGLDWNRVSEMVKETFKDLDVEIVVRYL